MKPKIKATAPVVLNPQSPAAHAQVKKMLRRQRLLSRIKELEVQLAAANGESRQNMRKRFARVTGELAEAKKEVGNLTQMNENLLVSMVEHGYDREKAVWTVKEEVKS